MLIALGSPARRALARRPGGRDGVGSAGAAFLLGYGVLAARRAWRPGALHAETAGAAARCARLLTALALTWLNPHVYLDTVVLLGSVAAAHGDARWWFALGAAAASVLWFCGLGFGARLLRRPFERPGRGGCSTARWRSSWALSGSRS